MRLRKCQIIEGRSNHSEHAFLNSDAHFLIVVDIGGGSVA